MNPINYAKDYSKAPDTAYTAKDFCFADLYNSEATKKYNDSMKKIEIPVFTVSGMQDYNPDTPPTLARRWENAWESKTISNALIYTTLVSESEIKGIAKTPKEVITAIQETLDYDAKRPFMACYTTEKIYNEYLDLGYEPEEGTLTASNIMTEFDKVCYTNANCFKLKATPILYCPMSVALLIRNNAGNRLHHKDDGEYVDNIKIQPIDNDYLWTEYEYEDGEATPADGAQKVLMLFVNPDSVICPAWYEKATIDEPTAATAGSYVYTEILCFDVFILENKSDGVSIMIEEE